MNCLAILVNFHCARLIVDAVASLADDSACEMIHVVDNSESEVEAAWLKHHLPARVKLIVSPKNIGFARACNLAMSGMIPDSILLLNPDARLLPGALSQLKESLEKFEDIGAVGPRVFWDNEEQFLMPPSTYPSRLGFAIDLLGQRWPWISKIRARQFRRTSLAYWLTTQPIRVSALSGGHVLLRNKALVSSNGLFDPQFFMYWEDTDLMRRLNDRGWKLLMEPRAKAVHWYEHTINKDYLLERGWTTFRDKYFSNWFWRKLTRLVNSRTRSSNIRKVTEVIPAKSMDISINVPESLQSSWLLEIGLSIDFIPSIGRLGKGPVASLPMHLAERFKDKTVYLRVSTASTLDALPNEIETFVFTSTSSGAAPIASVI